MKVVITDFHGSLDRSDQNVLKMLSQDFKAIFSRFESRKRKYRHEAGRIGRTPRAVRKEIPEWMKRRD